LPIDLKSETPFATHDELKNWLVDRVHRDLNVTAVRYYPAITVPNAADRMAYIVVELVSKRQAHMVSKSLRKVWFGDSLLKVKMAGETKREVFDNRTVLIRGFPSHYNQRQLLETFIEADTGSVVGIELPMQHAKLAEFATENDKSAQNIRQKTNERFNEAELAVQDALSKDAEEAVGDRNI
jgi:hypothetical protein